MKPSAVVKSSRRVSRNRMEPPRAEITLSRGRGDALAARKVPSIHRGGKPLEELKEQRMKPIVFAMLLGLGALCVLPADVEAASKRGAAIGALKDRIEAFQGTSQEGSGIRRAAPRVVIRGFAGTQTEGT